MLTKVSKTALILMKLGGAYANANILSCLRLTDFACLWDY